MLVSPCYHTECKPSFVSHFVWSADDVDHNETEDVDDSQTKIKKDLNKFVYQMQL